jgi:hypothetical protein
MDYWALLSFSCLGTGCGCVAPIGPADNYCDTIAMDCTQGGSLTTNVCATC